MDVKKCSKLPPSASKKDEKITLQEIHWRLRVNYCNQEKYFKIPPLACLHTLHFMQNFAQMTPNNFQKNKEIQMFCIIAYHRSIKS